MQLAKVIASAPREIKALAAAGDSFATGSSLKAWGESLVASGPDAGAKKPLKNAAIEHGERLMAGATIGRRAQKSAGVRS